MSFFKQIQESLANDLSSHLKEDAEVKFVGASILDDGSMVAKAAVGETSYEVVYKHNEESNEFTATQFNLLSKTEDKAEVPTETEADKSENPDGDDKEETVDDEAKTEVADEVEESVTKSDEEAAGAEETKDVGCGANHTKQELDTFKAEMEKRLEAHKVEILNAVDKKLDIKVTEDLEKAYASNTII